MKHSRKNTYIDRSDMRTRPSGVRGVHERHGSSMGGFKQTVRERPARMSRLEQERKPTQPTAVKKVQPEPKVGPGAKLQQARQPKARNVPAARHAKRSNVLQRHLVHKPKNHSNQQRPPRYTAKRTLSQKLYRPPRYAFALASLVLLFGLVGALTAFFVTGSAGSSGEAQVLSNQSGEVRDRPEQIPMEFVNETPREASEIQDYKVDASAPRLLRINSIDVTALIKPVGVDMSNRLITPDNIFDVGWYEGSRQPGQSGVVVLNGHVAGANDRGALYYARALEAGDVIEIERGDGKAFSYEIVETHKISYHDMRTTDLLIPHESGANGLTMVVVDNRYNVLTDEFQDRLVIHAVER